MLTSILLGCGFVLLGAWWAWVELTPPPHGREPAWMEDRQ